MKKTLIILVFISYIPLISKDYSVSSNIGATFRTADFKNEHNDSNIPILYKSTEQSYIVDISYNMNEYFSIGAYIRHDTGNRQYSFYLSQNEEDILKVFNTKYSENWFGPFIKGNYKNVFLVIGYGLPLTRNFELGIQDEKEIFVESTSSLNAILIQTGGKIELIENLYLTLLVELRTRRYDKISNFENNGTQYLKTENITPMVGISYNFDM